MAKAPEAIPRSAFPLRPWTALLTVAAVGVLANIVLIAIPGFYGHDEIDWRNRIARNEDPWMFGLGSPTTSSFFRPLGAMVISASLRTPLQPIAAHLIEVLIAVGAACLLYGVVALFRPDRALAAALLFMLTPGFAYGAGWVAAGFDVQFVFWGLAAILCAIVYWRGGDRLLLLLSLAAFTAALGSKETALSIPVCALIILLIDWQRIDGRRAALLAAGAAGLAVLYLALRWAPLHRVAASGSGGYRFGSALNVLRNALPYFGFPFASGMPDVQSFPMRVPHQAILFVALHLALVGLILWRAGPRWALIYLAAFYATLLPVLALSKYETQYAYASSIAIAVGLATVWERRPAVAVPVVALGGLVIAHSLWIQLGMYRIGACQTRALATLEATLPDLPAGAPPTLLVSDDTPWGVVARSLYDVSFPLRGAFVTVTVTRDPQAAGLAFHADCRVSIRDGF